MLKTIPKVAHFFWGSTPMPYLNYLTLTTFKPANPSWKMVLHRAAASLDAPTWKTGEQGVAYHGEDWSEEASALCIEEVHPMATVHSVHQADMLRHQLMAERGGIWSDMDVLWLRPIEELELPESARVAFSESNGFYSTGIVLACPGTSLYRKIHEKSLKRYRADEYQVVGPGLIKALWPTVKELKKYDPSAHMLPMDRFYPYAWNEMERMWVEKDFAPPSAKKSIAIHWFGGNQHSMEARNRITPENVRENLGTLLAAVP